MSNAKELAALHIISSWCLNEEISIPRPGAMTPNSHWWRTGFHGQNQSISSCSRARDGTAQDEPDPPCILDKTRSRFAEESEHFQTEPSKICLIVEEQHVCKGFTVHITRSWGVSGWSLVPSRILSTGTGKTWQDREKRKRLHVTLWNVFYRWQQVCSDVTSFWLSAAVELSLFILTCTHHNPL